MQYCLLQPSRRTTLVAECRLLWQTAFYVPYPLRLNYTYRVLSRVLGQPTHPSNFYRASKWLHLYQQGWDFISRSSWKKGANDMLTLLLFHSFGWLHWPSRRVSWYLASRWVLKAPNSAEKIEHGSIRWLAQNHSPVTRAGTIWADYKGIYSAEHSVGVIGPLLVTRQIARV